MRAKKVNKCPNSASKRGKNGIPKQNLKDETRAFMLESSSIKTKNAPNYACLWTWMTLFHLNLMLESLSRPHPRQFDSFESYTWQSLWYDTVVSTEQTTVVHSFSYLIYNVRDFWIRAFF